MSVNLEEMLDFYVPSNDAAATAPQTAAVVPGSVDTNMTGAADDSFPLLQDLALTPLEEAKTPLFNFQFSQAQPHQEQEEVAMQVVVVGGPASDFGGADSLSSCSDDHHDMMAGIYSPTSVSLISAAMASSNMAGTTIAAAATASLLEPNSPQLPGANNNSMMMAMKSEPLVLAPTPATRSSRRTNSSAYNKVAAMGAQSSSYRATKATKKKSNTNSPNGRRAPRRRAAVAATELFTKLDNKSDDGAGSASNASYSPTPSDGSTEISLPRIRPTTSKRSEPVHVMADFLDEDDFDDDDESMSRSVADSGVETVYSRRSKPRSSASSSYGSSSNYSYLDIPDTFEELSDEHVANIDFKELTRLMDKAGMTAAQVKEVKARRRRLKNRHSARLCSNKKRERASCLEEANQKLLDRLNTTEASANKLRRENTRMKKEFLHMQSQMQQMMTFMSERGLSMTQQSIEA